MKIRVISSREEIGSLMPNEKIVHLAYRASNVDFLNLMQRCPRLRAVQIPPIVPEDNVQCYSRIPGHARHRAA